MRRSIYLGFALIAVLTAALPAAASANRLCKSGALPGLGSTLGAARTMWIAGVTKAYGSVWSNINIAEDYSTSGSGILQVVTVSATPCRPLLIPPTTVQKYQYFGLRKH